MKAGQTNIAIYSHALLRIHITGGQRSVSWPSVFCHSQNEKLAGWGLLSAASIACEMENGYQGVVLHTSVHGPGMKTGGLIVRVKFLNSHSPIIY